MKTIQPFLVIILMLNAPMISKGQKMTDKQITKTAIVNCSLDTAWWKWTTHEGLKTFFGGDNHMELKVGGPFEIHIDPSAPDGSKGSEGSKVLSYLPKQMLSFSWSAPPYYPTVRNHPHKSWLVLYFRETEDQKTEIELHHYGWLEGDDWDQVHNYFDKAWSAVLSWMQKSCE
jgi:uncharacterized protein YndB with AHSA1/START domain